MGGDRSGSYCRDRIAEEMNQITSHYDAVMPWLQRAYRQKFQMVRLLTVPDSLVVCELDLVGDIEELAREIDSSQKQVAGAAGPGVAKFILKAFGGSRKKGTSEEITLPLLTFVASRTDEGADWTNDHGQIPDVSREGIERMRLRHLEIMFRQNSGNVQRQIEGWSKLAESERAAREALVKETVWLRDELAKRDKILLELGVAQTNMLERKAELDAATKRTELELEGGKKILQLVEAAVPAFINKATGVNMSTSNEKPLTAMVTRLVQSITPDQFQALFNLFSDPQKVIFNEILRLTEEAMIKEKSPTNGVGVLQ